MGAPGSGKSAVARALADEGCAVIDADRIARETLELPEVVEQLVEWWGPDVVEQDGRVDRARVASVVFESPEDRVKLEELVHPKVHAERDRLRKRYSIDPGIRAIVEDCPLLLETGLDKGCDVLVFVDASRSLREQRVWQSRGWSAEELSRREEAQIPLDIKRQRADYVIVNNAEPQQCRVHSSRVLFQILHSCPSN